MDRLIDRFMDFLSGKLEHDIDKNIREPTSLHSRYEAGEISKEEAKAELKIIEDRIYARKMNQGDK